MAEFIETPLNYAEFLRDKGGLNPLGQPRFILHWGNPPGCEIGVPDIFFGPYLDAWSLSEWKPAEAFGRPEHWDDKLWGREYPSRGMYLPIQVFREGSTPVMLDSEALNFRVLELFLWVIMNHENDSLMKRTTFLQNEQEKREALRNQELIDRIEEGAPAFGDAVAFTGQLNVNSVLKQKMDALERNLPRILESAKRFSRGGVQQQSI